MLCKKEITPDQVNISEYAHCPDHQYDVHPMCRKKISNAFSICIHCDEILVPCGKMLTRIGSCAEHPDGQPPLDFLKMIQSMEKMLAWSACTKLIKLVPPFIDLLFFGIFFFSTGHTPDTSIILFLLFIAGCFGIVPIIIWICIFIGQFHIIRILWNMPEKMDWIGSTFIGAGSMGGLAIRIISFLATLWLALDYSSTTLYVIGVIAMACVMLYETYVVITTVFKSIIQECENTALVWMSAVLQCVALHEKIKTDLSSQGISNEDIQQFESGNVGTLSVDKKDIMIAIFGIHIIKKDISLMKNLSCHMENRLSRMHWNYTPHMCMIVD
jgi:hypothetical protein